MNEDEMWAWCAWQAADIFCRHERASLWDVLQTHCPKYPSSHRQLLCLCAAEDWNKKKPPSGWQTDGSYVFYLSKCPKCPIGLQARLEPCRGCSHQSWSPQTVAAKWRLSGFRGYHPRGWESPISGSSQGAWWAAGQGFSWLTPPHALHISWAAVWADDRQVAGVAP